jgi:hypothetical protein
MMKRNKTDNVTNLSIARQSFADASKGKRALPGGGPSKAEMPLDWCQYPAQNVIRRMLRLRGGSNYESSIISEFG